MYPIITPTNSDEYDIGHNIIHNFHTDIPPPYHATLSQDPINNIMEVPIKVKGKYLILGLHIQPHDNMNQLQLIDCILSTPTTRIPKWRSTLCHEFITQYNKTSITSIDHLHNLIQESRNENDKQSTITVATVTR